MSINKQHIKNIFIFILLFLISLIIITILPIWCDQIWSYGFSYNISKGMVIYRDFNVLQTPLYFFLGSIFIKIFGPYLISLNILNSLLIAGIGFLLYKMINWKMIFPWMILLLLRPSGYNILCILFLTIILYLINRNKYNYSLVAVLVGLIFITKQNIGVLLFIPMFIFSKQKMKDILLFIVPILIICFYLMLNNALYKFIDYSFLGLISFTNNKKVDIILLIIVLISITYLVYCFIKSKFKNKEALYILLFQLIVFPLCEVNHFGPAFVMFLYFFIKNSNKLIIKYIVCTSVVIFSILFFKDYYSDFTIHTKKDLFYLVNDSDMSKYLNKIYNYFNKDIKNVYIGSEHSYLLKLYYNEPITEFDYIMSGNLGLYSKDKIYKDLDKRCEKNACYFLFYEEPNNQFAEFYNHVKKDYKKKEILDDEYIVYEKNK